MKRISLFLAEEDVPDWACSLTRPIQPQHNNEGEEKIGFTNATLEWHRMEDKKTSTTAATPAQVIEDEDRHPRLDTGEPIPSSPTDPIASTVISTTVEPTSTSNGEPGNTGVPPVKAFKLQNVDVSLPHGELTLVTGITGAGKTAFLVALLGGKCQRYFILFFQLF